MKVDRTPPWAWQLQNALTLACLVVPAYLAERQFAARFGGRLAWYHHVGLMACGLIVNFAALILVVLLLAGFGWVLRRGDRVIRWARRRRSRPKVIATDPDHRTQPEGTRP